MSDGELQSEHDPEEITTKGASYSKRLGELFTNPKGKDEKRGGRGEAVKTSFSSPPLWSFSFGTHKGRKRLGF